MDIKLKRNLTLLVLISSMLPFSCSNRTIKYPSGIVLDHYDHYKRIFVSSLIYRTKTDTIWHDKPFCWTPDIVDDQAYKEIDSLVNLSVNKLWNDVKIAVEPQEVKDFVIEEQCIANELLLVLYSEDLDSMARAYAKRMKIKQDNTKH